MTDDPNDARDERLAARLQTEPLEDVTRARLVRNAMAASEPAIETGAGRPHRSPVPLRWLAVAAAVIVLLAIGIAVLAHNDSGSGPTAARAPKAAESPSGRAAAPSTNGNESQTDPSFSVTSDVQTLGNLGDVSSKAELRGAVADVLSSGEPPAAAAQSAAGAATATPLAGAGCAADELGQIGRTIAIGTGTVNGAPVTVYVVERSKGDRVAVVVGADCTVGTPVAL